MLKTSSFFAGAGESHCADATPCASPALGPGAGGLFPVLLVRTMLQRAAVWMLFVRAGNIAEALSSERKGRVFVNGMTPARPAAAGLSPLTPIAQPVSPPPLQPRGSTFLKFCQADT